MSKMSSYRGMVVTSERARKISAFWSPSGKGKLAAQKECLESMAGIRGACDDASTMRNFLAQGQSKLTELYAKLSSAIVEIQQLNNDTRMGHETIQYIMENVGRNLSKFSADKNYSIQKRQFDMDNAHDEFGNYPTPAVGEMDGMLLFQKPSFTVTTIPTTVKVALAACNGEGEATREEIAIAILEMKESFQKLTNVFGSSSVGSLSKLTSPPSLTIRGSTQPIQRSKKGNDLDKTRELRLNLTRIDDVPPSPSSSSSSSSSLFEKLVKEKRSSLPSPSSSKIVKESESIPLNPEPKQKPCSSPLPTSKKGGEEIEITTLSSSSSSSSTNEKEQPPIEEASKSTSSSSSLSPTLKNAREDTEMSALSSSSLALSSSTNGKEILPSSSTNQPATEIMETCTDFFANPNFRDEIEKTLEDFFGYPLERTPTSSLLSTTEKREYGKITGKFFSKSRSRAARSRHISKKSKKIISMKKKAKIVAEQSKMKKMGKEKSPCEKELCVTRQPSPIPSTSKAPPQPSSSFCPVNNPQLAGNNNNNNNNNDPLPVDFSLASVIASLEKDMEVDEDFTFPPLPPAPSSSLSSLTIQKKEIGEVRLRGKEKTNPPPPPPVPTSTEMEMELDQDDTNVDNQSVLNTIQANVEEEEPTIKTEGVKTTNRDNNVDDDEEKIDDGPPIKVKVSYNDGVPMLEFLSDEDD